MSPKRSASSLAALSDRLAALEEKIEDKRTGFDGSEHVSALIDERLKRFGLGVRAALVQSRSSMAKEFLTYGQAAAADAMAAKESVQDLHDRVAKLEMGLASAMQEHARLMVAMAQLRGEDVLDVGVPGAAAAEAAAAGAREAQKAAHTAEIAASAAAQAFDAIVRRQQHALEEGLERERRLQAQVDALTAAIAEQATASTKSWESCRAAADAGIERLHRRWSEWEATQGTRLLRIETEGKASEAQLRSTQLALRKLSILSEQVGQPGRAGIVSAAPPAGGSAGPRSLAMAPAAS